MYSSSSGSGSSISSDCSYICAHTKFLRFIDFGITWTQDTIFRIPYNHLNGIVSKQETRNSFDFFNIAVKFFGTKSR